MIIVIDNYDSFTYNLVHYIGELEKDIKVIRNDEMSVSENIDNNPSKIVISPGPSTPKKAGKSILIDIENEGWKFTAQGYSIDLETGLYFGKKNSFAENQNMFISGITQKEKQSIKWEFEKIA